MSFQIIKLEIIQEHDIVLARQRARTIAGLLGFDTNEKTRISTAVSEIVRNSFVYAGGGQIEFLVEEESRPQLFLMRCHDKGPGIQDVATILEGRYHSKTGLGLGIIGTRRLMDKFRIESTVGGGTTVILGKYIPLKAPVVTPRLLSAIADQLMRQTPQSPLEGLRQQNQELLHTLSQLSDRQRELDEKVSQLNRANEKLQELDRMKSMFIANMSHEIRTPMNAILGFAQVLDRDPSLMPRQREQVRSITRGGEHLLKLINDILDMSKIEAGQSTLQDTVFCLHGLLEDLELLFRSRAQAEGLQFLVERDDGVPRYVCADEGKLRQILVNLVGNAVKFTKTGGVSVRARAEAVRRETAENAEALRLVIEVEDTGPGIQHEDMELLFGAFQQGLAGLKAGGTGLGLAISRRLARMMGGDVTVRSEAGRGSVFLLEVLAGAGSAETATRKKDSRRVLGLEVDQLPCKVLVVEDQEESRTFLIQLLRTVGFEVLEARNGKEAVAAFPVWRPHLILMDYRMHVMNGDKAIQRIRRSRGGDQVKIITLTASTTDEVYKDTLAAGADDFMAKPFRAEELFEKIGLLTGVRYLYSEPLESTVPITEPSQALTREMLAELPAQIRDRLQDAVIRSRQDHLLTLIQEVSALAPETGDRLRHLTRNFEYETVIELLT